MILDMLKSVIPVPNLSLFFSLMADHCTICLAMDRLWFHQIIFLSEHTTSATTATIMLSNNNLKIPEQHNTLDDFNQNNDEEENYKKNEITRSNSSSPLDRTHPTTISRPSYTGPMMRLQKTMSLKTLLELELEEVKGFIDLGFKFSPNNLNPITMSLVPGLQRMGWPKKDKAQWAQFDDEDVYEEDDDELEDINDKGTNVMRPYLSEAWLIKRPDSPLLNLKLPRGYAKADMKKHLKYWARTVASVAQQES